MIDAIAETLLEQAKDDLHLALRLMDEAEAAAQAATAKLAAARMRLKEQQARPARWTFSAEADEAMRAHGGPLPRI